MKKAQKIIKLIYIIAMIVMILTVLTNICYAQGIELPDGLRDIYSQDTTISTIGGRIIWVVQVVFYAAAVVILMIAGLSYMFAAPEGKAEIKKKMIYLSIGAVLLFAAGGITQLIAKLAFNNIKGS